MSTIVCRQLTFGYDGSDQNVFTNLDLVVDTGWRSALVGRNGRGKTTLLRLIQGELAADKGVIERAVATLWFPRAPADPTISAFDAAKDAIGPFRRWEADMHGLLDAGDDVALEQYGAVQSRFQDAGGYEIDANVERELVALEVDPSLWKRPFQSLSGGEQTRCLLASLFALDTGFPLIDEPTNHLDRAGREHLADYLKTKPGFLMVSHDRTFLDACIDHVIALNPDTVETQRTTFSLWREHFHQRLAAQESKNAELKKDIGSFEATARRRRAGAIKRESDKAAHVDKGFIGARAARQMKRAIDAERRAQKAVAARKATLIDTERSYALRLETGERQPRSLVTATNLVVHRDRALFDPISFSVAPGDRLAILGANGSGKTSLVDVIAGASHEHDGFLVRPAYIQISRAYQQPQWTSGSLRDRLVAEGLDESRFRQIMAVLGVRGTLLEQPLESLSHGQQKKIDLARSFLKPADLLIWDEPLNFIDIDAREQIEEVLLRDAPTLIFIEHDAAFVDHVATKHIELSVMRDVDEVHV